MEIPDELCCLFSSEIEAENESYTFTVPTQEIVDGDIQPDTAYRVALLKQPAPADSKAKKTPSSTASPTTRNEENSDRQSRPTTAPVEEGDRRTVEIEGVGEQGDGIARVDRGYVIIVPDTEQRDRVTVEITNVTPSVAFAEVVERKAYYE
ncbi:Predicted RNA-binding protein, contains TRAM domain [Haladaptatus litoreus]|uniref:Predicted RNA-binding protein, contains TRAM domain n=1 Tax=Haladaptatus litoreus TaxID=553468 RepID=A0A1N7CK84_9EURY|nr:TRAM domain-containing protein [Haladaptatus litoreus]SIR63953.1 Predicted RNA-binding protein, contains TRAM domain [Haladaptatus litoreus]